MNDKNFEHLWNAYIDGELSALEASEFEASLSDEDRALLSGDMQFENGLADRLGQHISCPDDVWARVKAEVTESSNVTLFQPRNGRRPLYVAASIAAAVLIAFVLMPFVQHDPTDNSAVVMAATSVEELAEGSLIEPGREVAERYLREHGIQLKLNAEDSIPVAEHHYDIKIVGAREGRFNGEPVQEILMGCCGHPAKLLAAPRGSATASSLLAAASRDDNDITFTRNVGDYIIVAVGDDHAQGLLDIFGK